MQADDLKAGHKYLVRGATVKGTGLPPSEMEYLRREAFVLEFRLADGGTAYMDVDDLRSGRAEVKPVPTDPDRAS